jgi:hypothetical protein
VCSSVHLYHPKYLNGFRCNSVFGGAMLAPYPSNTTPKIYENQIKLNFLKSDPLYKDKAAHDMQIDNNVNIYASARTLDMGAGRAQSVKRLITGLTDVGVRVRVPLGVRTFCSLRRPNRVRRSIRPPIQCLSGALSPAGE